LPVCFGAGTIILTQQGEQPVETLSAGDMLKTLDGSLVAVKWVGRQTISQRNTGERAQPVAGALGGGLPHGDLTVTGDQGAAGNTGTGHSRQPSHMI